MDLTAARPRLRVPPRALLVAALVLALAAGGWLWFRDSGFVRVKDVFITGVSTSEQNRVRAALRSAALDMTTLHVREDALRTAVEPFASVRDIRIEAAFPHKLSIEVIEHAPVAALQAGSQRVPVNAQGLVLRGVRAESSLATVRVDRVPAERIEAGRARAAIAVLAAAPATLRERSRRAWFGAKGLTVELRDGPPLIFGDARDAAVKWAAAARVLADAGAAGAAYLDVRVPGRVAAGGLGPVAEETATPSATATVVPVIPAPTATPLPTPAPTTIPVVP
jgi:cell division protein FtsQ